MFGALLGVVCDMYGVYCGGVGVRRVAKVFDVLVGVCPV